MAITSLTGTGTPWVSRSKLLACSVAECQYIHFGVCFTRNSIVTCDMYWPMLMETYKTSHLLTHWGRDKTAAVSLTTLPNAFSWMKGLQLRLKFHRGLFLGTQFTIKARWPRHIHDELFTVERGLRQHSLGCCWRNSRPTMLNLDHTMTTQFVSKVYDEISSKSLLSLLSHYVSLLHDGNGSFTYPVVKGPKARGTLSGTSKLFVAVQIIYPE